MAVAEVARGRGIGRRLLARCEREARRAGRHRLVLEVRADNRAARALYEQAGYRVFAIRRRGYYEDGADALRMSQDARPAAPAAPRGRAARRERGR
ncbi:MAG: GNAT family N-acetyltransferase [Xanthomonadales bacterium]|nr:GNAT family N-acetyltransferase [Xanthomonadales bacterium]